ncbi:MAG: hypothetical protein ABJF04_10995 [Reichenbachiella sp.]|uniref:hypothetical protein n=1 Tax=Reichenbachiella sp. TaxID=2184521 RepID=UPI003267C8A5
MPPKHAIDQLVKEFFALFTTLEGTRLNLDKIHDLCLPEAIIIKNVDGQREINNLAQFIQPREKLLNSGALTDFSEQETWEQTSIFGHIAQRFCIYEKSGKQNGEPFHGRGMKTFQFILTDGGWKISSLAWDDESESQKIEPSQWS